MVMASEWKGAGDGESEKRQGEEGEDEQGEDEGSETDPGWLSLGHAVSCLRRRGAGDRVLQESVRRDRGDALSRAGRQDWRRRGQDRRLARDADTRLPRQ